MPKRKTHEDISRLLLGKSYSNIDAVMDFPSKFMGSHHRKVMHSVPEAFLIGLVLSGNLNGAMAGVLHVITDVVDSGAKEEIKNFYKNRGEKVCLQKRKTEKRKKNRNS